jgi:branched-chain amino acid aminotransferase
MNNRLIWHCGNIISVEKATINILSPTCQYGINVFEGMRAYWQEEKSQLNIFRMEEHTKRLISSAKMLRLNLPYTKEQLQSYVIETIKANNYKEDIAIRQTIYLDGEQGWSGTSPTNMFIAPIPKGRSYPDKTGLHCRISTWERINDRCVSPRIKAGANYINSRMAQLEAMADGYDSAIFLNIRGNICEAPGSCIFVIREGKLITPPLTASVLDSITRATILYIAREILNIPAVEREIDRTEFYDADEIFLCGTAVEIIPVISVDRFKVGSGTVGETTKSIKDKYFNIVRGENNSTNKWLTPVY